MGCFFSISVLAATSAYVIEHKLARKNRPNLINDNRQIKITDYCLSFLIF